jgi:hypothetical protein
MSSLVEALSTREITIQKAPEKIDVILNQMNEDERFALLRALDAIKNDTRKGKAKVYSCAWLSEVLTSHGYSVSRTTIKRYLQNGVKSE